MAVVSDKPYRQQVVQQPPGTPLAIPIAAVWHLFVLVGALLLGFNLLLVDWLPEDLKISAIYTSNPYLTIGSVVHAFLGMVMLFIGLVAIFSTIQLFRQRPSGRYAAVALNYTGMVLTAGFLLHLWGFFTGFDVYASALYENSGLLLGFIAAFLVYRAADWLPEDSQAQIMLERVAIFGSLIFVMLLLVSGGALDAALHILNQYDALLTWLTTIAVIIFGAVAYSLLRLHIYFGEDTDQRVAWQGWLLVSPNIIGFLLFFAGPLLLSLYISFTDSQPGQAKFIGTDNYERILSLQFRWQDDLSASPIAVLDTKEGYLDLTTMNIGERRLVVGAKEVEFWLTLKNTIEFCIKVVPLGAAPALVLAVILNSQIPGMRFFRVIYFLPSVAAVVGSALIWQRLYAEKQGFINTMLSKLVFSLNDTFGLSIANPSIGWLSDPGVMLNSVVILAAWQMIGFNTVLFLAGLQNIPGVLYEASFVDGANRWQQFWRITVPLLGPTTFFVVVTNIITGLQVFNEPFVLNTSQDAVPIAMRTSVYHLYDVGFRAFKFGESAAVAWLLFILIFAVTLIQFRAQRRNAEQY